MSNAYRSYTCRVVHTHTSISVTTNVHTKVLAVGNGKTSVDTGVFIPGVYRVNPYEIWQEEIDVPDATQELTWKTSGVSRYLNTYGALGALFISLQVSKDVHQSVSDDLMQQAHQKAQAKVAQSDLSLGEDLGEIRETLAMLKNPLSSMREFLLADSKRNLRTIKSLLKFRLTGSFAGQTGRAAAVAASNTWLELRYGFRPLIMLIGDLMEQANSKANATFKPEVIRCARAKVTMPEFEVSYGPYRGIYLITYPYYKKSFECFYRYRDKVNLTANASVQYRQSSPMSTLQNLGLTPSFWPEIAWELTRLSFVWDWFVSIGPWLQSYRFKPTIEILGSTVGIKKDVVRDYTADYCRVDTSLNIDLPIKAPGQRRIKQYRRYVNPELPLTPLLRLDKVIDLNKLVDSLSLIIQRIFR